MSTLLDAARTKFFPCPICCQKLDVRTSKKDKPYVVCQACGMQMFLRTQPGIQKFEKQVTDGDASNLWARLDSLESQYQKTCPKCETKFWVNEKLRATDWFGEFVGYSCSEPDCDGVVKSVKD
jgi:C4-type Zn-finger protein